MDGDGKRDAVVMGDREAVFWYRIPARPVADGDWDLHIVSKIWRAWPGSANSGKPHVDWLENLRRR